MEACLIGTSGWSYNHWQGVLYPSGLPAKKRLEVYIHYFLTVELNSSLYHWPRDTSFKHWAERLPEGFRLSEKAPRGLTHAKRLAEPETWLERIRRRLDLLDTKRGVLLVQLPPDMPRDDARLEAFLQQLPPQLLTALEFRHLSWHVEPVFSLLERFGTAYCVMSGANLPCILRVTAPFVYVRLHGPSPSALYAGSYSEDDLRWWAARLGEWRAQGRSVAKFQTRRKVSWWMEKKANYLSKDIRLIHMNVYTHRSLTYQPDSSLDKVCPCVLYWTDAVKYWPGLMNHRLRLEPGFAGQVI